MLKPHSQQGSNSPANSTANPTRILHSGARSERKRAWLKLLGLSAAMGFIWLVVLPRVASIKPLAEHIERMERQDIAVEAMFYTDLNWQPPDGAAWRH